MKKIFLSILIVGMVFLGSACGKNKTVDEFKNMYESYNGQVNASGVSYRNVTILDDHPFEITTAEEIVKKIKAGETFYVYFGFATCPWCRSVIETAITVAKEKQISKIYYVDILQIRDVLSVNQNGEVETTTEGSEAYMELLDLLNDVLADYSLTTENGKSVETNEKRIYAPNYVYVEKGSAKKLIEGTSPLQTDSHMELTQEILEDQRHQFEGLFSQE